MTEYQHTSTVPKRPKDMRWKSRLNGAAHGYLTTQVYEPDGAYPYGGDPILLSIKDWWISIERAEKIHAWLGEALKFTKSAQHESRKRRRKRK